MKIDRRHLAIAGVTLLGASTLLRITPAFADDEVDVTQAVEALRKAWFDKDKVALDKLTAAQLSYGHSGAVVQTKAEFIDGVMSRKTTVKSLSFPDLKITMAGNNAIARHRWISESELDGKTTNTEIGVMAVWTKLDGGWKLLARQAYKLG